MPFQIQFDGAFTLSNLQAVATSSANAVSSASAAQGSANSAAAALSTATTIINSDISAVTSDATLQEAAVATLAANDLAYLAYLPLYPGATLLAGFPTTLPGSSGQWWVDRGVFTKS